MKKMNDLGMSYEEFSIINKFVEMEKYFSRLDLQTKECMKSWLTLKIKNI